MGTNSAIGIKTDNVIYAIHCQWDGYLDYNGRILKKHYNAEKTKQLIVRGSLSSLDKTIKKCSFYIRDMNKNVPPGPPYICIKNEFDFISHDRFRFCEYFYLFKNNIWYTYFDGLKGSKFVKLTDKLIKGD